METSPPALAEYLVTQVPSGLPLSDAAQLCMRLYCTVEGVPEHLAPETSRDGLAEAFSFLAVHGWVLAEDAKTVPTTRESWLAIVQSVTRPTELKYDMDKGEAIATRVGFNVKRVGSSGSNTSFERTRGR